jgi:uncharacterized membrane protein
MQSEACKVLHESEDRRTLSRPAERYFDYLPTYILGGLCFAIYHWYYAESKHLTIFLFLSAVVISISAARCGKKEVHRKIAALRRQLEEKNLL